MKRAISLFFVCVCLLPGTGWAKLHRYTADFYKVNSAKYVDQDVRVYAFSAILLNPTRYNHPGYSAIEVKTTYNDTHGGSMVVAVPTDEAIPFKDKYSVRFEDAMKLSGTLRRSTGEHSYLYIEYGSGPSAPSSEPTEKRKQEKQGNKQYTDDYYELLAEEYVGQKITLQATSALLDKSERLDHINNSKAFVVNTPNEKIKGGRIAVVVPNELVSHFAKTFMKNTRNEPRDLSGYLYKHQTKKTSFLFLYCSNEPLDLDAQKPVSTTQDYLHELIAIYMDLGNDGKDELIELARELDSPEPETP